MTKAVVLELASTLTLDQIPVDALSHYYDEALYALGALPFLVEATLLEVDALQSTFQLPETAIQALEVWYGERTLDYMTHAELDALSPYWQDERSYPVAYTDRNMSLRTFQLYPLPVGAGVPFAGLPPGGPFGQGLPAGRVGVLASSFQQDMPSWLELPVAFTILAREYLRESDHKDAEFAKCCLQMGRMLLDMLRLPSLV